MSDRAYVRRKHSSVDLQQVVTHLDVYKRPLVGGGKSGALLGFVHEAAVATTEKGTLFLIEKGVSQNDDVNYLTRYREGECRIVQLNPKNIRNWTLVRSVEDVKPGLTLEDLFDRCGSDYSFVADNCWNGTHRMRVAANDSEDGLVWQEKATIVGVGAAVIGAGLLAWALSPSDKEKKEKEKVKKKEAQKY